MPLPHCPRSRLPLAALQAEVQPRSRTIKETKGIRETPEHQSPLVTTTRHPHSLATRDHPGRRTRTAEVQFVSKGHVLKTKHQKVVQPASETEVPLSVEEWGNVTDWQSNESETVSMLALSVNQAMGSADGFSNVHVRETGTSCGERGNLKGTGDHLSAGVMATAIALLVERGSANGGGTASGRVECMAYISWVATGIGYEFCTEGDFAMWVRGAVATWRNAWREELVGEALVNERESVKVDVLESRSRVPFRNAFPSTAGGPDTGGILGRETRIRLSLRFQPSNEVVASHTRRTGLETSQMCS